MDNSFRYAGEIYDKETGFYYLCARYYNPSVGRFISEDTYKGQVDNPLTLNHYTYTHNNPLRFVDPSGHINSEIGDNNGTNRGSKRDYYSPLKFPETSEKSLALQHIYDNYGLDAVPKEYRDWIQIANGSLIPGAGLVVEGRNIAATLLRNNMIKAGIKVPDFSNAAHHIVAWGDKRAEEARKILTKFEIDINDAVNGVFLPIKQGVDQAIQHARIHTNVYYQEVNRLLKTAQSREEVIEILNDIKEQILNGTFKIKE